MGALSTKRPTTNSAISPHAALDGAPPELPARTAPMGPSGAGLSTTPCRAATLREIGYDLHDGGYALGFLGQHLGGEDDGSQDGDEEGE